MISSFIFTAPNTLFEVISIFRIKFRHNVFAQNHIKFDFISILALNMLNIPRSLKTLRLLSFNFTVHTDLLFVYGNQAAKIIGSWCFVDLDRWICRRNHDWIHDCFSIIDHLLKLIKIITFLFEWLDGIFSSVSVTYLSCCCTFLR